MKHIMFAICFIFTMISVGCSSNTEKPVEQTTTDQDAISITDFSDRTIILDHIPERIVSLGNGETDIIYALGAEVVGRPTGEAIVAASENALEVGSTHSVDLEKVTSLKPDIVLGNDPMNINDVQAMESIGAEMLLTSANSVDDIKRQIDLFGTLLHKEDKAETLITEINGKMETLQHNLSDERPRVLLVYGAPGTNMAALPNSLSGNMLEVAGGENIASDYPSLEMYPQYAQLNTERIIESDPQIILLMSHGNPEEVKDSFIKEMQKTAGWKELDAVKNDRFIILPAELFGTNPGTKVMDALDYLHELLEDTKE